MLINGKQDKFHPLTRGSMMKKHGKQLTRIIAVCLMGVTCLLVSIGYAGNIISAGGAIDDNNDSIQVVGQTAIGVCSDASIRMFVGGLYTLNETTCLKGDVDLNGLIDGNDIDDYITAVVDGLGSPQQLCAADLEIADFATLLLGQ